MSLAGMGHRHWPDSTLARPSQPGDHRKISAHRDQQSVLDSEPTGFAASPCFAGGPAYSVATPLTAWAPWIARNWKWRTFSAATVKPIVRTARAGVAIPRSTARHDRDRGVLNCSSRRSSRAPRLLQSRAALLRQLRGSSLPKLTSPSHVQSGLKNEPPKFSTRTIFMSSSPFPNRLLPSLTRTKIAHGILFRATAETLSTIAADPQHLGAEIGFLPYFTVGDKTCFSIRMCIVSFQAAGFHLMVPGGSPAAPTFSYQ